MGPKSEFKFITVDATEGSFQTASKSTRSHAIRTAIQRGRSELGTSTASISQDTIKQKAQLKGRFRLAGTTLKSTKSKTPKYLKEQENEHQDMQSSRRSHVCYLSPSPDTLRPSSLTLPKSPSDIAEFLHQASLPPWVQRLGSDSADPFNTLPIPSSPCVDSLVKYCKSRSFCHSRAGRRHAAPLLCV